MFVWPVLMPSLLNMTHTRMLCTTDLSCPRALNCHHRITSERAREREKARERWDEWANRKWKDSRGTNAQPESVSLLWTVRQFLTFPNTLQPCCLSARQTWDRLPDTLPVTLIYLSPDTQRWKSFSDAVCVCIRRLTFILAPRLSLAWFLEAAGTITQNI